MPKKKTKTTKKADTTLKIGTKVKVNGNIYWGGNGGNSIKKKNATMYIVDIVDRKTYKYCYGVAAKKGGTRQGWAAPKNIKKI